MRRCKRALLVVAILANGCFFMEEKLPKDLQGGDVTGVAVGVPPGETGPTKDLLGASVRRHPPLRVARSHEDGRFTLKNLPPGEHRLRMTYDPNNDGQPDLVARVDAAIRVRDGVRSFMDLGRIELLKPSTIAGRVTITNGTVTPGALRVALMGVGEPADALVLPDAMVEVAADNTFVFTGLGAGAWRVVAVHGSSVSAVTAVNVNPDETKRDVVLNLDLGTTASEGTIQFKLVPPLQRGELVPSGISQGLVSVTAPTVSATPLFPGLVTGCSAVTDTAPFSGDAELDVVLTGCGAGGPYTVRIAFEAGSDLFSVELPNVVVPPLDVVDLGRVVVAQAEDCTDCGAPGASSSSSSGANTSSAAASTSGGAASASSGGTASSAGGSSFAASSSVPVGSSSSGSGASSAAFLPYPAGAGSSGQQLPALNHPGMVAIAGNTSSGAPAERIFILGGCTTADCTSAGTQANASPAIWELDVTNNTVTRAAMDLPTGVVGPAASVGDEIYITGGGAVPVHYQYSASARNIRTGTAPTVTPWNPACLVADKDQGGVTHLYAFGNNTGAAGSTRAIHHFTQNTWTVLPVSLSMDRERMACATWTHPSDGSRRVVIVGGASGGAATNRVEEFDTRAWMVRGMGDIPTGGRQDAAAVVCNNGVNRLYLLGGNRGGTPPESTVLTLDLYGASGLDMWLGETLPLRAARNKHGAVVTGTGVYVFGGSGVNGVLNSMERGNLPGCPF